MRKKIILLAVFLPACLVFAESELTTDNLIVSSNAAIYGNLNFYTIAGYTTNEATATGGTITTNGDYRIHTFTNSGTFTVSGGSLNCDVLVVAGGGGGGIVGEFTTACGGGGGGGVIYTTYSASGEITVTIGAGGTNNPAISAVGQSGGNSVFGTVTATGGGGGGEPNAGAGGNGGSGGGGPGWSYGPGSGTAGQGYGGGTGGNVAGNHYWGGGGGGASEIGGNGSAGGGFVYGGEGGEGYTSDISGSSRVYGSGGGGDADHFDKPFDTLVPGVGGTGGGTGASSRQTSIVTEATSATYYGGGGGGGGKMSTQAGNGFQGIVIVRYSTVSGSNVTTLTISSNGINQVSASGVNTFMGKMGIGTDTPAEKLHVAGNAQIDGTNIVSAMTLGGETRTNWPSGAAGALMASNNLNDVTDKAAARSNLGLGSAATNDAGVFLTPTSDGSQLTNITAAQVGALSTNAGALIAANNLSELTATAAIARDNLGLGSAAINDATAFLAPAGNGSQLTGITAAQVGALSTNGGVVNGSLDIQYIPPKGDLIMGSYTNQ